MFKNPGIHERIGDNVTLLSALIGIFISGMLTIGHLFGKSIACGQTSDCEKVALDSSSNIFGIPLSLFGFLGFLTIAGLWVARHYVIERLSTRLFAIGYILSALGFGVSMWLTYHSIVHIKATCMWCIGSALCFCVLLMAHGIGFPRKRYGIQRPRWNMRWFAVGAMATVAALSVGAHRFLQDRAAYFIDPKLLASISKAELIDESKNVFGNPNAEQAMVVFTDLECPACAGVHHDLKLIAKKGKTRIILRHCPLPMHLVAMDAAVVAEMTAEKGLLEAYTEAVFDGQKKALVQYVDAAAKLGLDPETIKKRLKDPADPARKRVERDFALAKRLRLGGTPTMILQDQDTRRQLLSDDVYRMSRE